MKLDAQNYFIEDNMYLRRPQREAYTAVKNAFQQNPDTHKIVVLPTGTGKTGLIGCLPLGIAKGRVLIITPGLIIREGISDAFDTRNALNFWSKHKVIINDDNLPTFYRYAGFKPKSPSDKKRVITYLNDADIIVTNIHKVSGNGSKQTLTNLLKKDFFDMIIIDEAHHSEAQTWLDALDYFDAKKIIKLTATPFRDDKVPLTGDEIYNYKLSDAIKEKYIKNIVNETHSEETLQFEVDGELVDKETALTLMDANKLTRSVAYSMSCSKTIVDISLEKLSEKRTNGNAHHQIIAVACSIDHAKQITELYRQSGASAEYVSSEDTEAASKSIIEFKKGQIDVLVNVDMLGEGFDHPNISIAAIFRPFRSLAPYAQFIGRALRRINSPNAIDNIDNIANVVYHTELQLDELWKYYTSQTIEAQTKSNITRFIDMEYNRSSDISEVKGTGAIITTISEFLNDGSANHYKEELQSIIKKREQKLNQQLEMLRNIGTDEKMLNAIKRSYQQELEQDITNKRNQLREELLREELHNNYRKQVDELLTNLFIETSLDPTTRELVENTSNPMYKSLSDNAAYTNVYVNYQMKRHLKRGIDEWERYDFEEAEKILPDYIAKLKEKINNMLKEGDN
ncbi:DEAD/DEAH box helicase [Lysinibacillus sp. BF-4]|uniref:DEAD/DEAH box helicase n=1 Tax=Lysinibacillus sp. BF-4 TaxID=1473546 RepID=UPI00068A13CD|nr:DEAD/DEAH box helicase family protein [Lysinibacillus sp. BF-4]